MAALTMLPTAINAYNILCFRPSVMPGCVRKNGGSCWYSGILLLLLQRIRLPALMLAMDDDDDGGDDDDDAVFVFGNVQTGPKPSDV